MSAFIQRGSIEGRFLTTAPADLTAITLAGYNAGTDIIHGDAASAECLHEFDGLSTSQETIEYGDACSLDDKTLRGRRQLGTAVLRYVQDTTTNTIKNFLTEGLEGFLVFALAGDETAGAEYTVIGVSVLQNPEPMFNLALGPSRYEVSMSKSSQQEGVFA